METKIIDLPCLICWKPIGIDGIVKGMRFADGTKSQIALCGSHRNTQITVQHEESPQKNKNDRNQLGLSFASGASPKKEKENYTITLDETDKDIPYRYTPQYRRMQNSIENDGSCG